MKTRNFLTSAQSALVVDHIGYADRLAEAFHFSKQLPEYSCDDFKSAAYFGLCEAARNYDSTKGCAFKTYAYFRIHGAMYDILRDGSESRRLDIHGESSNKFSNFAKISRPAKNDSPETTVEDFKKKRAPKLIKTSKELAEVINRSADLNMTVHNSSKGRAQISYRCDSTPEQRTLVKSSQQHLRRVISTLSPQQRRVIELKYFEDKTMDEIRSYLGASSRSWISRLHSTAISHLRKKLRNSELEHCELFA
ncbi:MAG: sigma-70 family RNA polymerase sigma factor [Deltaproteobacteria bacterium]|nr:sigma-70 family RNA polymerase sigma factor [Deltaproteobacteria bacterium]